MSSCVGGVVTCMLSRFCREPITFVLQVPAGKKVRIKFTMFRMKEPGVDIRLCHKDYVEVMEAK